MSELITVTKNQEGEPAVSGRELHEFLQVETPYRDWFPRMLEYGFEEERDFNLRKFARVEKEGDRKVTRTIIDHIISMDMAKEISMIQRTERGKQARQYFIECEKKLREIVTKAQISTMFMRDIFEEYAGVPPLTICTDPGGPLIAIEQMEDGYLRVRVEKEMLINSPDWEDISFDPDEIEDREYGLIDMRRDDDDDEDMCRDDDDDDDCEKSYNELSEEQKQFYEDMAFPHSGYDFSNKGRRHLRDRKWAARSGLYRVLISKLTIPEHQTLASAVTDMLLNSKDKAELTRHIVESLCPDFTKNHKTRMKYYSVVNALIFSGMMERKGGSLCCVFEDPLTEGLTE